MDNKAPSAVEASIVGKHIRALRSEKNLTLKQLSELSGVSIATISKIETDKISGGFETIYKIARGLGVLVTEIMLDDIAATEVLVTHKSDTSDTHVTEIYDYFPQAYRRNGLLNPYIIEVKTRTVPDKRDWSIHRGEEVIIVLSGAIDLRVEGLKPKRLETGDSACFDCGRRHAFVCTSQNNAQIVSISSRSPTMRMDGRLTFS